MKKILFCIIALLFLTGCEEDRKERKYYVVQSFNISKKVNSYVSAHGRIYDRKISIYEMDLLDMRGDSVHEDFASNYNFRFIPGDTIYFWDGRWLLKNK